jgi:hypothetical protein
MKFEYVIEFKERMGWFRPLNNVQMYTPHLGDCEITYAW